MADYQTHCIQCGKLYSAKRKSSKYCGDKCRQNYHRNHREGVNVDNELYKALDSLRLLDKVDADELSKHVWYIERINTEIAKINDKLEERVRLIFGE